MSRLFDKTFFNQFLLFLFIIVGAFVVFAAAAYYQSGTVEVAEEKAALKLVPPVGAVVVPSFAQ